MKPNGFQFGPILFYCPAVGSLWAGLVKLQKVIASPQVNIEPQEAIKMKRKTSGGNSFQHDLGPSCLDSCCMRVTVSCFSPGFFFFVCFLPVRQWGFAVACLRPTVIWMANELPVLWSRPSAGAGPTCRRFVASSSAEKFLPRGGRMTPLSRCGFRPTCSKPTWRNKY